MAINSKKNVSRNTRSFLARDFSSFRDELLRTARVYFPDKIRDFSEPSVGGLFLDMAAVVGDSLSFYLDHSFRELDPDFAVENDNIEGHLRNAGVEITGAFPSSAILKITLTIPAELVNGEYIPKNSAMPTILRGTSFSNGGLVTFTTTEDIDFSKKNNAGNFIAVYNIRTTDSSGNPETFDVSLNVLSVSGTETTQEFVFADFVPFQSITLDNRDVTDVISVVDSENNTYYEVESLAQDNVFASVDNAGIDSELVSSNLELTPAPHRFLRRTGLNSRKTTLIFGSGDGDVFDDDILPDPSEVSLELFGKKKFKRFSVDPNALLKTQTLGISPANTTLTVVYRFGGGLNHNVPANSITEIENLLIEFRNSPSAQDALSVRQSVRSVNVNPSTGGDDAPSTEVLRARIRSAKNAQMRVVTKEDLLARIYSMPSQFGSVYRAAIEPNPTNPLSSILYVCSLDADENISVSPDSLKLNLSTYLNQFRLISDAVDVLDVRVINFGVKYEVILRENSDRISVINSINSLLASSLERRFFQIGQPIVFDDLVNIIINFRNVISLTALRIFPISGDIEGRSYSTFSFPFEENTKHGILRGPKGSIFEMRFPGFDISGTAL